MRKRFITAHQMTNRILERDDNDYKKEVIYSILNMYMDECRKALIKGERVQMSGLGTIIPEVKTHRSCFLPRCNNDEHENAPYTRIKIRRTKLLKHAMNNKLLNNIENGIYGLEDTLFDKLQINNLKACGYIPEDEENDYEEE